MRIVGKLTKAIKTLTSVMAKAIEKFRSWLADKRNFLFDRYTKDAQQTQEPEKSLIELPPEIQTKLVDAVENLPNNPADKKAIAESLDQAYAFWHENRNNADNSIVILSSPVAAVSRILSETLEEWAESKQVPLTLLPLKARPIDIEGVVSKLEHYLKKSQEDQLEIVVIPNLSWCFLRSMEGLAGIEYIQSLLCNGSKNRFWIIGAGEVGWQYLNSVCSLEAYCGKVFSLPGNKSAELQEWLEPISQDLDITFDEPRIDQQILDGDKNHKASYFDHLADISRGISTVAVQVFLKSIHYEEIDQDENEKDAAQPQEKKLIAQTPQLPQLPDLEPADQYLLYSLLLHGDLTISSLAQSLGDLEVEVQTRVQLLRREGVIQQQDKVVKINPVYYPRVKQVLANNNFIINRE